MNGTERLSKTTDRLDQGYRIAQETEEIGLEIMDNLQRDRETIQRARGRVLHMHTHASHTYTQLVSSGQSTEVITHALFCSQLRETDADLSKGSRIVRRIHKRSILIQALYK